MLTQRYLRFIKETMYHPQDQRYIITCLTTVCDVNKIQLKEKKKKEKKRKKRPLYFRFRKRPARALLPESSTTVRDHDMNPVLLLAPGKGLRQSH